MQSDNGEQSGRTSDWWRFGELSEIEWWPMRWKVRTKINLRNLGG